MPGMHFRELEDSKDSSRRNSARNSLAGAEFRLFRDIESVTGPLIPVSRKSRDHSILNSKLRKLRQKIAVDEEKAALQKLGKKDAKERFLMEKKLAQSKKEFAKLND